MGFEIDYLPVGEGEKSGDAIAVRFGNLRGSRDQQVVMVIDGGTKDSGGRLVEHVRGHFGTDRIDLAWCTHADGDHASGLTVVLEQMEVGRLLMHQPWNHAEDIRSLFKDGRITDESLGIRIRASLQAAHDLEQVALRRGVPIVEPFQGDSAYGGCVRVLGPSKEYYQGLIPQYRKTPDPVQAIADMLRKAAYAAGEAIKWVGETLDFGSETLAEPSGPNGTSAENNSSLILLFVLDGHKFLLTGDAGVPALEQAADYASALGLSLTGLRFLHVPHHGSKRNVGPSILNRIKAQIAFISASAGGVPKHPSKKVVNALIRRGSIVYATQGIGVSYGEDAPVRYGWSPASTVPFSNQVEE